MEMERIIGVMLRWCLTLTALMTAWAMRFGRWTQNQIIMHKASKSVSIAPQSARGVPALASVQAAKLAAVPINQADVDRLQMNSISPSGRGQFNASALEAAIGEASRGETPTIAPIEESHSLPDELDWAGSLSHAAVAAMHVSNVLTLVRLGGLVAGEAHKAHLDAVMASLEAFQIRTEVAIAPLLEAMTVEQQAAFFDDFGEDFPSDLRALEAVQS